MNHLKIALCVLNVFNNRQLKINTHINKCVIKFKLDVFFTSILRII